MKVPSAIVVVLLLLLPSVARAEARFALLIGNQSYDPSVGVLKNPHNDIAVVGQALSKQGFELLPPIKDARRSVMLAGVRDLVRRLNAAGSGAVGFIYYSGHGAAEKDTNINYLIPVDAKEPGTTMFWDDSLKLDDVLRLLEGARSAAKFIVFDACRNELQLPTKDTTKGLVPVAQQQGMFIAYASAPGRTASDRGEKSGPYAEALATQLASPGLDHLNLFQNVKEAVLAATGGAQQPWESNGLGRRIYLTGPPAPTPALKDLDQDAARRAAMQAEVQRKAQEEWLNRKEIRVALFVSVDLQCHVLAPAIIEIVKGPRYGTLAMRVEEGRVGKGFRKKYNHCAETKGKGRAVYYVFRDSDSDRKGSDTFSIRVVRAGGNIDIQEFEVNLEDHTSTRTKITPITNI